MTKPTATSGTVVTAADSAMAAMPGMAKAPMVAMTGSADHDFLRMMTDHHKGLIALVHPTIEHHGSAAAVRAEARQLDKKQDAEVVTLSAILSHDFNDSYVPHVGPDDQAIADSLARVSGSVYDRTFYAMVIRHHQRALSMIDEFMPKLTGTDLRRMAQQMKTDQAKEIADFERKLGMLH